MYCVNISKDTDRLLDQPTIPSRAIFKRHNKFRLFDQESRIVDSFKYGEYCTRKAMKKALFLQEYSNFISQ